MAKIIALSGVIGWDITANSVREALAEARGADVEFHASSPGGLVYEGIEIFNIIRGYSGRKEFLITGIAASMMSYIALSGDKVKAYDNATFMIHNPWNFTVGDYNDMQEMADYLKGLTGILAKEYVKKTEKTQAAMKVLMDKDSYFFGDEMLSEGFIDEIIEAPEKSDDDDDRASAIVTAQASVQACYNRMKDSDAANSDMQKAVAYMDGMSALIDAPKKPVKPVAVVAPGTINKPAVAGTNKEDKYMSLEVLLADNPAARAEHDAAIAKARAEGEATARDAMKAVVAKVEPILKSTDYPDSVKAFGAQVLTGEKTVDGFEAVVFMEDQRIEAAKAEAAKKESDDTDETPGGGAGADVEAKAKFDEKKKRMEQGV